MREGGLRESGESFRAFWLTLLLLNAGLAVGGATFAARNGIAPAVAAPIIAAFLLQASLFVVPGFPRVRRWIENRLTPPRLAWALALVSPLPYLIFAVPCGVFSWGGLAFVAGYSFVIAFLFVWSPPGSDAFSWQDLVIMVLLAYAWVSGLGSPLNEIYRSPAEGIPDLDFLGKLMLATLGAMAYLSLRRLPRTGYRFAISREDFLTGLRNFVIFVPFAAVLSYLTGFASWGPRPADDWTYPFEVAGNALGIYLGVALPSELYFRGVLQNLLAARLGRPQVALLLSSLLFGLSHLGRGFPNWPYAAVSALLGWFCGRAYAQRQSVVAAGVTHTLAVLARRYFFP